MIVRESISFQRGLDPKGALNIGIRNQIEKWLEETFNINIPGATNLYYRINDDLTINVFHRLDCRSILNGDLPEFINFSELVEDHSIPEYKNMSLRPFVSLVNCKLTTLRGFPKKVQGSYAISKNPLKTLENCPKTVFQDFYCTDCPIDSLEGCPEYVGGDFTLGKNRRKFTEKEIRSICEVGGQVILDDNL